MRKQPSLSCLTLSCLTLSCLAIFACAAPPPEEAPRPSEEAVARVLEVAQEYVHEYYQSFPEEAYEVGYLEIPWDRLGDRSLAAMQGWEEKEDAWIAALESIDGDLLRGTAAAVPHAFARDRLEASTARRVCGTALWNVSPTWTGWQSILPSSFAQQPVGSPAARDEALARARDVARFLATEIANLQEGLRRGLTAPRSNVDAVIAQMNAMLGVAKGDSPFFEPAHRDADEEFSRALMEVVEQEIRPAIRRYRDFLADEYRSGARETVGVSANPRGAQCYAASIRNYTSLDLTPQAIHDMGLEKLASIQEEMRTLGRRSFGTEDLAVLLAIARTDRRYTFGSREEVLEYTQAAIDRAREAIPEWFGFVPQAEVVIRPYPDYQERTGGGFYSAGAADGSRPGTYEIGLHEPGKISKVGLEATTFHETYPGHHLQVSIGLERSGVHPILRYFFFSGTGEGWALYTERLADEMGLYSSDAARLGMLSNEALRAARLVVDTGMHALGWTRQQALDFLLANVAWAESEAAYEVDRYIAVPAQALSYLIGSLEIQRLRTEAEERLGDRFDIKEFHDAVIEDGTVTLKMLREKIEGWIAAASGNP